MHSVLLISVRLSAVGGPLFTDPDAELTLIHSAISLFFATGAVLFFTAGSSVFSLKTIQNKFN